MACLLHRPAITSISNQVKNKLDMWLLKFTKTKWRMPYWRSDIVNNSKQCSSSFQLFHHHHHNRFKALFLGPPGWAGARRELLDFMVQGKINRGRHTDHPAGRHSIWTNQWPPPPSPIFLTGRMPFLPPNQQCQSTEGNNSAVKWVGFNVLLNTL